MSDAIYHGEHSLTIGDKHTWRDWHLMPVERPEFSDAEPKFTYIEVPGSDGEIDASEALAGRLLFNMREGDFQFYIDNDHMPWVGLYKKMKAYVQGRKLQCILDDDPLWYYEGRFWFSEPAQSGIHMRVTLHYKVQPYKRKIGTSIEDLPWDPLTLDDIVQAYVFTDLTVSGETTLSFPADTIGKAAVVPTFIVTDTDDEGIGITLTNPELGIERSRALVLGTTTDPSFIMSGSNEDNVCTIKTVGNATFSIEFRSGEL